MDFEKIKITDIIPAPYNPRIMSDDDKEKLRRSMSEYGLVDPIIINMKNMTIIGGHQRYDILLEGYEAEQTSLDDLKAEYAAYKAETDKTIAEYAEYKAETDKTIAEKDTWIEKAKKTLAKNHIDI